MLTSILEKTVRPEREPKSDKSRGKRLMRQEYKIGQSDPKCCPTEERQAFRERILSFSLFPNLYNRNTIMTSLGAS